MNKIRMSLSPREPPPPVIDRAQNLSLLGRSFMGESIVVIFIPRSSLRRLELRTAYLTTMKRSYLDGLHLPVSIPLSMIKQLCVLIQNPSPKSYSSFSHYP